MARKTYKHKLKGVSFNRNLLILIVVLVGLLTALILFNNPQVFNRGQAALDPHLQNIAYLAVEGRTPGTYSSGPVSIRPCSGNWNYTECFYVKNVTSQKLTLNYFLDCWDETKCTDKKGTLTLTPGQEVQLGLGKPCSRWQLDLNWSGRAGWDWGGVVEVPGNCATPIPTSPVPTAKPTPIPEPQSCNYTQFIVK